MRECSLTDSDDKLKKINHMDEKPNAPSPDVPSSHEAKGEGSEDAPNDGDKCLLGPRK